MQLLENEGSKLNEFGFVQPRFFYQLKNLLGLDN